MKRGRIKRNTRYDLTLDSKVKFYYAEANGSRIYTNRDADKEYKNNKIHDPKQSTYVNLFVNGVLQPQDLFNVSKGKLVFKSEDVPETGIPIVLQFVKIFVKKDKRRKGSMYIEE